ncbi:hypothetical protein ACJZ2D_016816 [Fusarium nematophilum]
MFDIVFCTLPPHSTHILQPVDVGVFQFLKNAHQKALRQSIREGNLAFTRMAFAVAFKEMYLEGFSAAYIMSEFEKSGIYPISHELVVWYILQKQLRSRKAVEPTHADLLPKEARFQQAEDSLADMLERYGGVLSSPSREKLQSARKVLIESILMDKQHNAFVSNLESRIEKVTAKRKPGRFIKPTGMFITSVKLRRYQDPTRGRTCCRREKEQRRQLRSETGRENDYLSVDVNNTKFSELLSQKPDGFMIDIPDSQELRRARERASKAPRPILAFDFPKSDVSVTFAGLGPFNDGDDQDDDTQAGEDDPDGKDNTKLESLPRYMRSSPPMEEEPNTPCPRGLPPQLPPPSQPRQLWKSLQAEVAVMRANESKKAGQSHGQIGG